MNIKCSHCGTEYDFIYEKGVDLPPNFPFCSKRCKSIDLGKWLNEEYCISAPHSEMENLADVEGENLDETQREILAILLNIDMDDQ